MNEYEFNTELSGNHLLPHRTKLAISRQFRFELFEKLVHGIQLWVMLW